MFLFDLYFFPQVLSPYSKHCLKNLLYSDLLLLLSFAGSLSLQIKPLLSQLYFKLSIHFNIFNIFFYAFFSSPSSWRMCHKKLKNIGNHISRSFKHASDSEISRVVDISIVLKYLNGSDFLFWLDFTKMFCFMTPSLLFSQG